jgi:hypothetical protein
MAKMKTYASSPIKESTSKLTWDGAKIAPYESAWMTFNKILALNHIKFSTLVKLISGNKTYYSSKQSLIKKTFDSGWIDFKKYSSLIDVEPEILRMGFLNHYDIEIFYNGSYPIRHCPQCLNLGYHSIIFQFASIATCPWHECVLTKGCHACAMESSMDGRSNAECGPRIVCLQCNSVNVDFSKSVETNKLDADLSLLIQKRTEEIFDWKQNISNCNSSTKTLFSELFSPPKVLGNNFHSVPWKLRFASDILEPPPCVYPPEKRCRILHTSFKTTAFSPYDRRDSLTDQEKIAIFLEMERTILKEINIGHKRCIDKMLTYSTAERLKLDGTKVCRVALAYCAWAIAITGRLDFATFTRLENESFTLKMMAPRADLSLEFPNLLTWTKLSFYGILYKLITLCESHSVILFRSNHLSSDGFLIWATENIGDLAYFRTKHIEITTINVLYPDINDLLMHEQSRCDDRNEFFEEMFRSFIIQTEKDWFGGHGVIFKVLLESQLEYDKYLFVEL